MRRFVIASSLALPLVFGGCGVEPSAAAGASLSAQPKTTSQPVKPVQPLEPALQQQTPSSSVYALDGEAGDIRFGDGQQGRRLPAEDPKAASYRTGKGTAGNLAQQPGSIKDITPVATPKLAVPLTPVKVAESASTDDDTQD